MSQTTPQAKEKNSAIPGGANSISAMTPEQFGNPSTLTPEQYGNPSPSFGEPGGSTEPDKKQAVTENLKQAAAASDKPRAMRQAKVSDITLREHVSLEHQIVADAGVTREDTIKPEYYAHLGGKITAGNEIVILGNDYSWYQRVFVLAVGSRYAKVEELFYKEFGANATSRDGMPMGPEAEYRIDHHAMRGHRVIRIKDSSVVKENMATREEAQKWLRDYVRALAR